VSFFSDNTNEIVNINLLHQGAYFEVYKVKVGLRWYARKQISPQYRNQDFYIQLLQKEFEIGQHLDHPNIVKYLFLNKDESGWYLLTDFVEGIELHKLISNKKHTTFPLVKSLINQLLIDIGSALIYLHNKNIYHGDLSTRNIIYSTNLNKFILLDLGHAVANNYINLGGGTHYFTAPETINTPTTINASSDIYSIGKILQSINLGYNSTYLNNTIKKCCYSNQKLRPQSIQELLGLTKKRNHISWIVYVTISITFIIGIIITIQTNIAKKVTPNTTITNSTNKGTKLIDTINRTIVYKPNNSKPLTEKVNLPKIEHTTYSKLDSIVYTFSFLNDFKDGIKEKTSEKEMREYRINCILKKHKDFEAYLNKNNLSEKETFLLKEAYNKAYYNDYKKADSIIRLRVLK